MKKVEHEWQKQDGHEKVAYVFGEKFYLLDYFSQKVWDSTFLQTEEQYSWNLSKCSKTKLPKSWG